jgi:hypothetical protein
LPLQFLLSPNANLPPDLLLSLMAVELLTAPPFPPANFPIEKELKGDDAAVVVDGDVAEALTPPKPNDPPAADPASPVAPAPPPTNGELNPENGNAVLLRLLLSSPPDDEAVEGNADMNEEPNILFPFFLYSIRHVLSSVFG